MVVMQPCVKADFFQIIESGTCNFVCKYFIYLGPSVSHNFQPNTPSII